MNRQASILFYAWMVAIALDSLVNADETSAIVGYRDKIESILQNRCYDCHGNGEREGGVAFDELKSNESILDHELWLKVLQNVRSGIMPPPEAEPLSREEHRELENWIKGAAFDIDADHPDPGRVTVRRLNRAEYRNSIRDLLGIELNINLELPPDDVGYGFDNIGDVLSISPLRMEKFVELGLQAAELGVTTDARVVPVRSVVGADFLSEDGRKNGDRMSFYSTTKTSHRFEVEHEGDYRVVFKTKIDGGPRKDFQAVHLRVSSDGDEFFQEKYEYSDVDYFEEQRVIHWTSGQHDIAFETSPIDHPDAINERLEYRLQYVRLEGPLDPKHWIHVPGYEYVYTRESTPESEDERLEYAREILERFASKAFRRPVDQATLDRLAQLAESNYQLPNATFQDGIGQAIAAILSSPRFLFHLEESKPLIPGESYALLDEHSLACRLSYTLWNSLPDQELMELAAKEELRNNFRAQVDRMLKDPKSKAFTSSFAGQWLQSRSVLEISINSADVMALEVDPNAPVVAPPRDEQQPERRRGDGTRRGPRGNAATGKELTPSVREAMKQETESYFDFIVREDRSLLELLDSDYTFVNEELARVYEIENVSGSEMRRVQLPVGSARGGVITMGSVLTVTSNPTRTSPVKRGKWVLENILGAPPAPPPPDVPALEDAKGESSERELTQRELLAIHRADPICASCHQRMDPLGLALENFNAFGRYRTQERGQKIDPAGELISGEQFTDIRELKRSLIERHKTEFYRTITEKMLTYSLGRGVEYYDVGTVDSIVDQIDREEGKFSSLLLGVLESAPFQKRRPAPHPQSSLQ